VEVPVVISYSKIEELCEYDEHEGIVCDDFKGYIDVDVEEVKLSQDDLEKIMDKYLDDISDILKMDKRLLEKLQRQLDKSVNLYI